MIKLDATTKTIEVDLDAAVTTNQLSIVASYVDINQSTAQWSNANSNDLATNDTTAVTAVAAPAATTTRKVDYLSVHNSDTVAATVTVQLNNNTTLRTLYKTTLQAGETLQYTETEGWSIPNKKKGVESTLNSTTATLAGAATYTGTAEQNDYGDVMASCFADVAGTLYFDFSVNGTDWRTFPVNGFSVAAGIHEFHIARKGPRYFRARYVNGASAQSTFQLYTYFGDYGQGMAPIGFDIADDADAIVTKSVISGVGDTTAAVTNHKSLQVVPPLEGKTAFGEALVGSLTPIIQLVFPYNLNPLQVEARDNGGSSSIEDSMMKLSTGAAANQSSGVLSNEKIQYEPGLGVRSRFTAMFTTGVANSEQIIGIGDSGEGFFFGFNGADFGVLRRYGGMPEIRTLTVTTGSSTAENITITLDGNATSTVAVTNTGSTSETANEIAAHDYSGVGPGWKTTVVGSTVVFISWESSVQTGSYSLSSATTAVGTFAQTLAGVAPTDTWITQSSWNGEDIFDGNGLSGATLDPTKGNVFQIDFQYLGFGAVHFYMEDPTDGEMHLVHTIKYANANTRPSLDNPTMPMMAMVKNTSNTSDIVMKSGSMAAFLDGEKRNNGILRGVKAQNTSVGSSEIPILAVRMTEVFQSKINRSKLKLNYVSAAVEHTKPIEVSFYLNPTLVGASFSSIDGGTGTSSIETDTSATAVSGGVFFHTLELGKTGNQTINLTTDPVIGEINAGDCLVVTANASSGSGGEVDVSINLTEKL